MEWKIERVFEDLDLHVRAGLVNDVVIEYEVRDCLDGKFTAEDGSATTDLNQVEILVKGTIKWDGCSHNNFGPENGYLHACSRQEMVRFGELFVRLFDIAKELMPNDGDYLG